MAFTLTSPSLDGPHVFGDLSMSVLGAVPSLLLLCSHITSVLEPRAALSRLLCAFWWLCRTLSAHSQLSPSPLLAPYKWCCSDILVHSHSQMTHVMNLLVGEPAWTLFALLWAPDLSPHHGGSQCGLRSGRQGVESALCGSPVCEFELVTAA